MAIDFQLVLNSEKARDTLEEIWYNDVLQEEAKDVVTVGWFGDGPANSGVHRIVEWNGMYFFLGDDGHVEEGPFDSIDQVLALPDLPFPIGFSQADIDSDVLPEQRLLEIARQVVTSEGDVVLINKKRFVHFGGEFVEEPGAQK
jgi:hypothetical protein